MADFRLKDGERVRTVFATIATAVVVEGGDLVELDTGLIVKGTDTGAALAWAPHGSPDGDTEIEVTIGNDFTLIGTGEAVFAVDQKNDLVDLVIDGTTQLIDNDTTSTEVLQIGIGSNAGVVGSASEIEVRINKPLF